MADSSGTPQAGDGETTVPKQKTEKELKKEAEKLKKLEKFKAKQEKLQQQTKSNEEGKGKKKAGKEIKVITYDIPTEKGAKKDTTCPLPDAYSPKYVEAAWNDWWIKEGFFKPEYKAKDWNGLSYEEKFVMVIPPPNITGTLHLGHGLSCSIEDSICRWNRMRGKATLFVPGCDHAGIATQVVVERKIWREQQKTRHDIGRDAFVDEVWKWKNEKGDRILQQLQKLGTSCDWDRFSFTLAPELCKSVTEAFCRLHETGLIYRSDRLVNWSCTLNSAISDIEVDKKEIEGRTFLPVPGYDKDVEFGIIVSFAYKIMDSDEEIVVATTRIETMLGDTGVAVHPKDERYAKFHGKFVQHPFITDRRMPIILDEYVEMDFGTGAVKMTPAHDHNDYELGKRHNLQSIIIIDNKGLMADNCGQFSGMKRFDARKAVIKALEEKGLYRGTKEHPMVVPICSRSKDILEPLPKPQWYVDTKVMSERAVNALTQGDLRIFPDIFKATWHSWLASPRDWCISRQLWWGHRVPAYFVAVEGQPQGQNTDGKFWVSGRSEEEALKKAVEKFGVDASKITLSQDEDVLDTWFSSALFPFSVMGWPDKTEELKAFYPGHTLETGHDIIFFWVARMVTMGLTLMDTLPFRDVFLHALIRDAHGRKMSKSLGNIVDPLDIMNGIELKDLHENLNQYNLEAREMKKAIEGQKNDYPNGIPECGADALRFALVTYTNQGRDINLDVSRIQGYRFFCNKIWNAFKFSMSNFGPDFKPYPTCQLTGKESSMDLWIFSRLAQTVQVVNQAMAEYDFTTATSAVYNFWWYELCDWYLESLKPVIGGTDEAAKEVSRNVLYTCLDNGLRLIHPFMPFISEELFQRLPRRTNNEPPSLCVTPYPEQHAAVVHNPGLESDVAFMQSVVRSIRSMRSDYDLTPKKSVEVHLKSSDQATNDLLKSFQVTISSMCVVSDLAFLTDGQPPTGCVMTTVSSRCEAHLMLKGLIDVAKEKTKLEGNKKARQEQLKKLEEAAANPDYEVRVPEKVRQEKADKMSELKTEIVKITNGLETLLNLESS